MLVVLATAIGAPAIAKAAGTALHVTLSPREAAIGSAYRIGIDGTAPAGCVPHIERALLDGADLSIELSAPATGCKPRQVPFHLRVDPATTTSVGASPTEVFRVRVYSSSLAGTRLVAFALIDTASPTSAPLPESGFWWTQPDADGTPAPGTGMSLEFQENQIAASLLGFADSGAPTWYFGSTTLSGRVARIPLVQLANGDGWFSAIVTPPGVLPGPRLEIEFLSPARARAWLVRSDNDGDVQVRPLTLARTAFSGGPAGTSWVGRWVLIPEDGGNTRLFDFSGPSSRDAESFRLTDAENDAVLDCRLAPGTQQADACTLTAGAALVADFDMVGYDHISGHGANGAPIQLLRVPR